MPKTDETQKTYSRVSDFYNGKSIFMTGAAGFLGSILLEILLRCLPGIKNIYILLRPKKGIDPKSRLTIIFQKWIFRELLEKTPETLNKVIVISGDITQPNLGMSNEESNEVAQNASIIFHLAASTSFLKELRPTVIQNCLSTKYIIEFSKKLLKLDALIYTSTAYSNCNRGPIIKECFYGLPFKATYIMEKLESGMKGEFEKVVSLCTPKWPNNYAFSKSLTENILHEMASDLPVAIVRPSIIISTLKGVLPGYVEEGSGLVDLTLAAGKGFARVLHCNPNTILDLIPADIVANTHIVAAWSIGTLRSSPPFIINCTNNHELEVSLKYYKNILNDLVRQRMLPKSFQEPSVCLVKNKYLYWILFFYHHYIPGCFIDMMLYFKGKKFRILPLYKFFYKVMACSYFFLSTTFDFMVDNFKSLREQLDTKDKEIFYMDLKELRDKEFVNNLPTGAPFYDWNNDKKSPAERRNTVRLRTRLLNFIKRFSLALFCYLFYIIFCQLNIL